MDGLRATHEIRAWGSQIRQPYICALTANAMEGDADNCIKAGMDMSVQTHEKTTVVGAAWQVLTCAVNVAVMLRYLSKPVTIPALQALLLRMTQQGDTRTPSTPA